jgi:hypothetical protein
MTLAGRLPCHGLNTFFAHIYKMRIAAARATMVFGRPGMT